MRCERFDYTCSESCTKAEQVVSPRTTPPPLVPKVPASLTKAVRLKSQEEQINRSDDEFKAMNEECPGAYAQKNTDTAIAIHGMTDGQL